MERVPVLLDGKTVGELTAEREGLYLRYRASCRLSDPPLLRLFAVGREGELRLGVPEPRNGDFCLARRLSAREAAPAGALLRGELRSARWEEDGGAWQTAPEPDRLFRGESLRRQLRGCQGVLTRTEGSVRYVAVPFDCRRPFRLTGLFCFARVGHIGGRAYTVFCFDREENPVLR
jgi:hypothetical protein